MYENCTHCIDYWTIYNIIRQVEKQHRQEYTRILARILTRILARILAAGCEQLTDAAGSRHSGGGFASLALAHGSITRTTPFVYLLGFSVLVLS